jgi:ATP-dependent DNA helicase RecG
MVAIARFPCGRSEIAQALGHKSVSGAAKQAIADLMEAGLVEYVLPEKPNTFNYPYSTPAIGHDNREIAVTLP